MLLLRIFAAFGAVGALVHTLTANRAAGAMRFSGLLLLRFLEYYFGLHLAYALGMLAVTEATIRLDKTQKVPSKIWHWHMEQVAQVLCLYGGARIAVTGSELLPKDTRYLMVANHRSLFDPLVSEAVMADEGFIYVSKPSNFKIPVAGKVMHKCGSLALDRENNREALKTIKQAAEYIEKDYASVVIYPEGRRCRDKQMLPFHAGSFKIAQKTGVPIVCAVLRNTDKIKENFPLRKTDVYIDIVGVIDAAYVKAHKTKETAELAYKMIQDRISETYDKDLKESAKC